MQFSQIAFAAIAVAVSASAHDISSIPSCALTPAVAAIGSTGCATTDYACICKSSSFITSIATAIQATCSEHDINTTQKFAISLCEEYGVTLPGSASVSSVSTVPSGVAKPTNAAVAAAAGVAAPTGTISPANGTAITAASVPTATYTGAATVQQAGGLLMAAGILLVL